MSDFGDEMDVDVRPPKDIAFSSDNTAKGKRSAANLPVEAEDSLPWCACPLLLVLLPSMVCLLTGGCVCP